MLLKDNNQKNIVRIVRNNDGVSRTEISKEILLSLPSVTKHIDFLIDNNIIYEDGFDSSSGGRRPIVLRYNYQRCIVLLISARQNHVDYEVSYLDGQTLFSETKKLDLRQISKDEFIDLINDIVFNVYDVFQQLDLVTLAIDGLVEDNIVVESNFSSKLNGINLSDSIYTKNHIKLIVKNNLECKLIGIMQSENIKEDIVSYIDFSEHALAMKSYVYNKILVSNNNRAGKIEKLMGLNNSCIKKNLFYKKMSYIGEDQSKKEDEIMNHEDWTKLSKRVYEDQLIRNDVYTYISNVLMIVLESVIYTLDPSIIVFGGSNPILSGELISLVQANINEITNQNNNVIFTESHEENQKVGMLEYSIEFLENQVL